MMVRFNSDISNVVDSNTLNKVSALWGIRILLDLNGFRNLSPSTITYDLALLKTFDIDGLENSETDKNILHNILTKKKEQYEKIEPEIEGILKNNLKSFSKLVGLSNVEVSIIGFTVAIYSHKGLENIADSLGDLNGSDVVSSLSAILDIPVINIKKALDSSSTLSSSGVLRLSKNGNTTLRNKLDMMGGLCDILQEPQACVFDIVRDYFKVSDNPVLIPDDYNHIADDYELLQKYLNESSKKRLTGVNILIHGKPGTGKSELVKTLSNDLGFNLYEISVVDRDGDAVTGNRRFMSYQLSQKILSRQKKCLILFDEVEDVFPDSGIDMLRVKNNDDRRKAWVNTLLESNTVPAFWLSNNIDQIDIAYIRRFDFVLKLDTPPKDVMGGILRKYLSELSVSSHWIDKVSTNKDIAPALVARAARVALTIDQGDNKCEINEANLEHIMGNTLDAMGYTSISSSSHNSAFSYCLDTVNPDFDISHLVLGLKHRPEGRLCLYGPPGTGKTEFAHYLAKSLDKPVIVKRASDLLGPYVGMTENHIASMYKQAQLDGAVLLLDEADSFLRSRNMAQQIWEVTQVNEMLTQMEDYKGIFICSTNMIDNLDAAALRRFDIKIYFDYLNIDQSWILFTKILKDNGFTAPLKESMKSQLSKLNNLTPGDFSTVVRQNTISQEILTPDLLLSILTRESEFKKTVKSTGIGFTANL